MSSNSVYIDVLDVSCLTNGYLEKTINWIPGMGEIKLKDLPTFIRITDPNDVTFNILVNQFKNMLNGNAIVLNTFDALERDVMKALSTMHPHVYSVGPLQMLVDKIIKDDDRLQSIQSNLWKEDLTCIEWLNTKDHNSVVYVNFGSITMMNIDQLTEFAFGLANSKKSFLWIIRNDLVTGELAMLPEQFCTETKERGMLANWCPQEDVLKHPAIAGFLTHCGWNSTLESISCGVPLLCWPFFADQQTNCKYCCVDWGIGMEIDNNVKRDEVELLVRKLIDGEKGKHMKRRVMELKEKAEEATELGGSSFMNFDKLLKEIILLEN
ncbi:transferase [Lithospermum erythrorhizon]|uniref:Transferase n=1 Tax=Lithospermum erythrorhizon TaxID=34254 RepID=A0AAV3RKT6_LITER